VVLKSALVVRGCVDVVDEAGERHHIEQLGAGFGGRNFKHSRRYHPGQAVTLPAAEVERLVAVGVLRDIVPWRVS
jgi:hypothetical protein